MAGKLFLASAMLAAMSGLAVAADQTDHPHDRVVLMPVGRAQTLVPVHVDRAEGERPYALTGSDAPVRMEGIRVGSRNVGQHPVESHRTAQ